MEGLVQDAAKDEFAFLRDLKHPKTIPFLEKQNKKEERFHKRHALSQKIMKEFRERQGEEEQGLPWTGADNVIYQFVYEKGKELETLYRNGKPVLDLGKLGIVNPGSIMPYGNSCIVGSSEGEPYYDARIFDFVTRTWYAETLRQTHDYAWCEGGAAFIYSVVETKRTWPHRVLLHRVGTPESADVLLFEETDPRFEVLVEPSMSGKFVFVGTQWSNVQSEWRAFLADDPLARPVVLHERAETILFDPEHTEELGFVLLTNWPDAPNMQLCVCSEDDAKKGRGKAAWKVLFPHSPTRYLRDFLCVRGAIVIECNTTTLDAADELLVLNVADRSVPTYSVVLDTHAGQPHYVCLSDQNEHFETTRIRYELQDQTHPRRIMELDLATRASRLLHQRVVLAYDPNLYESKRVWAPSRDGSAKIPISIVYKRSTELRNSPLFLYGYSAYGINSYPVFRSTLVSLLDRGWVAAVVQARGSSYLGRAWYDAGRMLSKMNSFFDVLDSAEYLAVSGYCDIRRIVLSGASAGGLLVLGAMVLAPPAFLAGVIADVPFCHVIASMSDLNLPLTSQELKEWGDPRNPEELAYMRRYSPYDNLEHGQRYPPVLLTGALADRQVLFHEPAMMAAKLRWCHRANKVLLRTEMANYGHGGNVQRFSGLEEYARAFAFAVWAVKRR
jgi:oligopeptidase B